jgi:4-amino-4-deoxy-L-arabinose transferase-like glycosyltransferase
VAVGAITLLALALRLLGLDQSLYGDELFTYEVATRPDFDGVIDGLQSGMEVNPPLFHLLAWLSAKLADPVPWLRLPSLVAGVATVPLLYFVARRLRWSPSAGLMAAALLALSPFAIFYSNEARGYATLALCVTASMLALLAALECPRWWRWALFAVFVAAALYTHYTAVFTLAALGAWALWFHRERARELLLAYCVAALAFVPWIPSVLDDRNTTGLGVIGSIGGGAGGYVRGFGRMFPGFPYGSLDEVPGPLGLALVIAGSLLAATAAVVAWARRPPAARGRPQPALVLVLALALATPLGLALYRIVGENLYAPRNLMASLPALCLLLGYLVARLRPALAGASAALLVAGTALGTLAALSDEQRRTPWRSAAELIESRAAPQDGVLQLDLVAAVAGGGALARSMSIHLDRPERLARGAEGWPRAARGARMFVAADLPPDSAIVPRPPAAVARRYRLVGRDALAGFNEVVVFTYARRGR